MYCHKCGENIEHNEKYCPTCGANLIDEEQQTDAKIQPDQQLPNRKKMIWGSALVLGLVVLSALLLGVLPSDTKALEKIVASAPAYYDGFIMEHESDEYELYEKLLSSSETALANQDKQRIKELLQQWEQFEQDITEKNERLYRERLAVLETMDSSLAYEDELKRIKEYQEQASQYQQSKNYIAAQQQLIDCMDLLDQINHSGEALSIDVAQIDTTAFPVIRLYLEILDESGNVPKTLPQEMFQVKELSSGTEYTMQQVTKLLQIDQQANLNIDIVADVSGSMDGYPLQQAQTVMQNFLNDVQFQIGDKVELTVFSDNVEIYQSFTNSLDSLKKQINHLQTGNMTSLYDA